MPAGRVFDRVILHEDELLCFGQIPLLRLESFLAVVKIFDLGVLIDRISRLAADIIHYSAQTSVSCSRVFCFLFVLRQHRHEDLVDVLIAGAHTQRMSVHPDQKIESRSEDRQQHDHQHPGHADRGGLTASVYDKNQESTQNTKQDIDPPRFLSCEVEQQQDNCYFQQD